MMKKSIGLLIVVLAAGCAPVQRKHLSYPAGQTGRLQTLFTVLSEDKSSPTAHDDWRKLSDNCGRRIGEIGAYIRFDTATQKASISFFCKRDGKFWNTPWYTDESLGRFYLHEYGTTILLFDKDITGVSPKLDFISPQGAAYTSAEGLVKSYQKGIVSHDTIEQVLRNWTSRNIIDPPAPED